jgi:hypothetical protein
LSNETGRAWWRWRYQDDDDKNNNEKHKGKGAKKMKKIKIKKKYAAEPWWSDCCSVDTSHESRARRTTGIAADRPVGALQGNNDPTTLAPRPELSSSPASAPGCGCAPRLIKQTWFHFFFQVHQPA